MDLWMVAGLGLGVFGAALATLIAQGISAVFSLLIFFTNVAVKLICDALAERARKNPQGGLIQSIMRRLSSSRTPTLSTVSTGA